MTTIFMGFLHLSTATVASVWNKNAWAPGPSHCAGLGFVLANPWIYVQSGCPTARIADGAAAFELPYH
jgi:hypothetical protein